MPTDPNYPSSHDDWNIFLIAVGYELWQMAVDGRYPVCIDGEEDGRPLSLDMGAYLRQERDRPKGGFCFFTRASSGSQRDSKVFLQDQGLLVDGLKKSLMIAFETMRDIASARRENATIFSSREQIQKRFPIFAFLSDEQFKRFETLFAHVPPEYGMIGQDFDTVAWAAASALMRGLVARFSPSGLLAVSMVKGSGDARILDAVFLGNMHTGERVALEEDSVTHEREVPRDILNTQHFGEKHEDDTPIGCPGSKLPKDLDVRLLMRRFDMLDDGSRLSPANKRFYERMREWFQQDVLGVLGEHIEDIVRTAGVADTVDIADSEPMIRLRGILGDPLGCRLQRSYGIPLGYTESTLRRYDFTIVEKPSNRSLPPEGEQIPPNVSDNRVI